MARRRLLVDELAAEINGLGYTADIADPRQVSDLFAFVRANGGLDAVVNCAALPANNIFNTPVERWLVILATNLTGAMHCCREAVPLMRERGGGHILNVGSLCIRVQDNGCDIYVASKNGLQGFTNSLRKEVAPDNIAVTLLNPGQIASDMVSESEEEKRQLVEKMAMLLPEDVAEAISFCLSLPERSVVTEMEVRPRLQLGL